MMRRHFARATVPGALALVLCTATFARAEDPQAPAGTAREPGRRHSLEIAVGAELLTAQGLGTGTATLTSNDQAGTPYTYFTVLGTRAAAPAFRGRVGYNITPIFTVEGGLVAGAGNIEGTIGLDTEGAAGTTVVERMTQYFVDASLLVHLRRMTFSSGAGVPFVEAGYGYLRQVHQDNTAIDTGQIFHVGGGITYMFSRRPTSRLSGIGVRADARLYVPRKGYSFSGTQGVFAGIGGSLVLAF